MGIIVLLVASIIAGVNTTALKLGLTAFPSVALMFYRFFLAVLIFIIPFLFQSRLNVSFRYGKELASIGVISFFAFLLVILGLEHTTVSSAQIILAMTPLFTLVGSNIFLKEKILTQQFVGFALGFAGIVIIALLPLLESKTFILENTVGNFLIVCSALLTSFYIIASKKLSPVVSPQLLTFSILFINAILFFIASFVGILFGMRWTVRPFILTDLGPVLYLAVFGSVIFFFLYQQGINKTTASIASLSSYIQVPVAMVLGSFVFHETITKLFILGALLALIGSSLGSGVFPLAFRKAKVIKE